MGITGLGTDQGHDEIIGLKYHMVQTSLEQLEEVGLIYHQTIPDVFANPTFFIFHCLQGVGF